MSIEGSGGSRAKNIVRALYWALSILAAAYIAIVIYAYPHDHEEHLAEAEVAKIQAQKLTESDVDGSRLPAAPDPSVVNATVAGVDANGNGIRDDVELAIFAKYPPSSSTSTAIRAAELQYAMDEQMILTDVFDTSTWQAATVQRERGFGCLYDASNGDYATPEKDIEDIVFNTSTRVKQFDSVEQYAVSYKLSSDPDCDVVRN